LKPYKQAVQTLQRSGLSSSLQLPVDDDDDGGGDYDYNTSILPKPHSKCLYALLGWKPGSMSPPRNVSAHMRPLS